jgi:hypothetical protein
MARSRGSGCPDASRGPAVWRLKAREATNSDSSANAPVVTIPVITSGDAKSELNSARIASVAWYSGLRVAIVRSQSGASDIGSITPDSRSSGSAMAWVSGASASSDPMTSAIA